MSKNTQPSKVLITSELILALYQLGEGKTKKERTVIIEKCKLLSKHVGEYIFL